jgi:hypothetical protein
MHGSPITKYEAQSIRQRDAALSAWLKTNKRNSYHPDELPAEIKPTPTNAERSNVEVFEFLNDPPAVYFAYVSRESAIVTTWTGQALSVGRAMLGREYRSNMGDKRRAISFFGVNGVQYHGTYYCGAGDYCRVKREA